MIHNIYQYGQWGLQSPNLRKANLLLLESQFQSAAVVENAIAALIANVALIQICVLQKETNVHVRHPDAVSKTDRYSLRQASVAFLSCNSLNF